MKQVETEEAQSAMGFIALPALAIAVLAAVVVTHRLVGQLTEAAYENRVAIQARVLRPLRRAIVFVVGMTVVLFGVALLVLPGPAFVVIPSGLAVLALEFAWARRLLLKAKDMALEGGRRIKGGQHRRFPGK